VAIVACPHRSTSSVGVKKRTLNVAFGSSAGKMNAVSEQFISLAIFFMSSSVRLGKSWLSPCFGMRGTTPAGFPPNEISVKASSW